MNDNIPVNSTSTNPQPASFQTNNPIIQNPNLQQVQTIDQNSQSNNKIKYLLLFLAIICLLLTTVVVIYLIISNQKGNIKQPDNNSKQEVQSFKPELLPSATPIPTIGITNWKTYSANGVSFNYPEKYTVKEVNPRVFNISSGNLLEEIGMDASLSRGLENYQIAVDAYKKVVTDMSQTSYKNGTKIIGNMQGIEVRTIFLPYKNGAITILTASSNISDEILDKFISEANFTF